MRTAGGGPFAAQKKDMFKYTKHFLKKLESLFEELGYVVRYEKGNFQSGYCLVENRKIAVINKFFDTEARIQVLLEILAALAPDSAALGEKSARLLQDIRNNAVSTENDEEEEQPSN